MKRKSRTFKIIGLGLALVVGLVAVLAVTCRKTHRNRDAYLTAASDFRYNYVSIGQSFKKGDSYEHQ